MTLIQPAELGRRIRQLRLERGLTLKEVEATAGVSATHVSEVERGRTSPTVGVLVRLAEALGTRPSFLLDTPSQETVSITRPGARPVLSDPTQIFDFEILVNGRVGAEISFLLATYHPGRTESVPVDAHIGDNLVHCLEGCIEIRIEETVWQLRPGDSLHFRATRPQTLRNVAPGVTRLLWASWPRVTI